MTRTIIALSGDLKYGMFLLNIICHFHFPCSRLSRGLFNESSIVRWSDNIHPSIRFQPRTIPSLSTNSVGPNFLLSHWIRFSRAHQMTAKASRRPKETVNLSKSFLLPPFTWFFLSITSFLFSDAITAQWCGMLFHFILFVGSPFWRCLLFTLQPYFVQTRTPTKPHKIDTAIPIDLTLKTPNEFHRHGMGVCECVCVYASECVVMRSSFTNQAPSLVWGVFCVLCLSHCHRNALSQNFSTISTLWGRYHIQTLDFPFTFDAEIRDERIAFTLFFYSFILSLLHFI